MHVCHATVELLTVHYNEVITLVPRLKWGLLSYNGKRNEVTVVCVNYELGQTLRLLLF